MCLGTSFSRVGMQIKNSVPRAKARVAVLVAHPDDETLWCGGLLLQHPSWDSFVGSLCRGNDPDRAPKFFKALDRLGAEGAMADLDDGPQQVPLEESAVRQTLLSLMPGRAWDIILTHGLLGEYTRHLRHEEVSRAVLNLWSDGALRARELWLFAYEDGGRSYLPRPQDGADIRLALPDDTWQAKYSLVTEAYGFAPESWEAGVTPRVEAFTRIVSPEKARVLLKIGDTVR